MSMIAASVSGTTSGIMVGGSAGLGPSQDDDRGCMKSTMSGKGVVGDIECTTIID